MTVHGQTATPLARSALRLPRLLRLPRGIPWLALPGIAFLLVFFALPAAELLLLSLQDPRTHAPTTEFYARLAGQDVYLRVLGGTLLLALRVTLLCLLLGYPVAYWLSAMPDRRRGRLLMLVLLPFWTSALIKSFTWLVLLGRNGAIARMLVASGLAAPPVDLLYGPGAVTLAVVHALLPLAILAMLPGLIGTDRRLLGAARTLGASAPHVFWRVTFHLSLPGVAAAGLLVFISTLGFFIAPALLGGPRQSTIASLIIAQVETMLQWNFASALAMLLVVATVLCCAAFAALFGLSALTGQPPAVAAAGRGWVGRAWLVGLDALAAALDRLGAAAPPLARGARWLLPAVSVLVIAFMSLPALSIIPVAFTSARFISFPPPGYSLHWMQEYFGSEVWMSATVRSFAVAFATGIAATLLAALAAFAVARDHTRWAGPILGLFLAPMVVPHVVTALGLFYLLARLSLAGTDAALVLGHTVLALPLVFITQLAGFRGYDWSLDRAAATLGANRLRTMVRVTVPLIKGGLMASFLLAFITSFEELTVAIFVSGGLRTTLPKQLWDDTSHQVNPTVAAASIVVMAVVTCLFLVAQRLRPSNASAQGH